jgi:inner membrane protease ATP23
MQACVRRRSVDSVEANPACPDRATAEKAVNAVWESCFKDTRPFDEVRALAPVFSRILMAVTQIY